MLVDQLVLIICVEGESRERIIVTSHKCGLAPVSCSTLDEARSLLARQHFNIVFCNDNLPDGDFRAVIRAAKSIPVIVLSRLAEWEPYLVAINAGAFEYIACPPDPVETERILWFALHESSRIHRAAQVGVINEMVVTVLAANESQAGFSILSHRLEKLGDNAALPPLTLKPPGYFSGDHLIWCCAATGYCLRKEPAPPMDE